MNWLHDISPNEPYINRQQITGKPKLLQQKITFNIPMGRNHNNKKVKKDQTPSEQDVSEQVDDVDQEEDFEDQEFDQEPDEQIDGDSVLLLKIQSKLQQVNDQEKLSWAAIYHIKQQQADMNEQMQKQIDVIKEKYEIQRIPLMQKISDAVAGKKLDKSVYADNEHLKSINLNKTKPKALKDYWGKVFDGCGLIAHENDVDLLQNLVSFRVDLIDAKVQNFKLAFEFEENEFFGKSLVISVEGSLHDGSFKKKIEVETKAQKVDENSLFGLLTGNESDDQQFLDTCHDLYRAYVSSTYFYFYEPADDLDEGEDDEDEEGDENEEDDDDDNENEVQAVQKPKGSSITEKPECKNQ